MEKPKFDKYGDHCDICHPEKIPLELRCQYCRFGDKEYGPKK